MRIRRFNARFVEYIPGLCQRLRPGPLPFKPDWIVTNIALDTEHNVYWIDGVFATTAKAFKIEAYANAPLEWRYDLTEASYQIGCHEEN